MGFVTVEVELDHGHLVSRGAEKLPDKAMGLLTILREVVAEGEVEHGRRARPVGLAQGRFSVPDDFNEVLPEGVFQISEGT